MKGKTATTQTFAVTWTAVLFLLLGAGAQPALAGYAQAVLNDNPLAYYRLGETSGTTAADATSNNRDGTYDKDDGSLSLGSAGPGPGSGFDGFTGTNKAIEFSSTGVDDFVAMPSGFLPTGSSARTIEGWFKTDSTSIGDRYFNYGNNSTGQRVSIRAERDQVSVGVNGDQFGAQPSPALSTGWHHLVLTYPSGSTQSGDWRIFVDGQELTTSHILGGDVTMDSKDTNQAIGAFSSGDPNKSYLGLIDEVAIYGSALSPTQVSNHFDAAVIPEPATSALLIAAGAALATVRRRRRC